MKFHSLKKTIFASMALSTLVVGMAFAEPIEVTQTGTSTTDTSTGKTTTTSTTGTTSADKTSSATTSTDKTGSTNTTTSTKAKKDTVPGTLSNFPTRSVVIIRQDQNHNKSFSNYMVDQLSNVFRYPYYNTSTRTETGKLDSSGLESIANKDSTNGTSADIYVTPYAKTDEYGSGDRGGFTGIYRKNMSDSDYKHTSVEGTLYYYDTKTHRSGSITKGFYGTQDALSMPSHQGVYKDVVDRMLSQLPYKRIPSDQPAYDPKNPSQTSSSSTKTTSVTNPDGTVTTTTTTTTTTPAGTTTTSNTKLSTLNDFLKDPKNTNVNQWLNLFQDQNKDKLDLKSLLKIQ